MICYAQQDTAFKRRIHAETHPKAQPRSATAPATEQLGRQLLAVQYAERLNRPLKSPTELIWQDRQYASNRAAFAQNQIAGTCGAVSFAGEEHIHNKKLAYARSSKKLTCPVLTSEKGGHSRTKTLKEIMQ